MTPDLIGEIANMVAMEYSGINQKINMKGLSSL
jgi:hypothetical protein